MVLDQRKGLRLKITEEVNIWFKTTQLQSSKIEVHGAYRRSNVIAGDNYLGGIFLKGMRMQF